MADTYMDTVTKNAHKPAVIAVLATLGGLWSAYQLYKLTSFTDSPTSTFCAQAQ
jgi:hypothetical protein